MQTRQSNLTQTRKILLVLGRLAVLQTLVLLQAFSQPASAQTRSATPANPSGTQINLQPVLPVHGAQDDCFPLSGGCMHTDVNIIRNADGSGRLNAVTRTSERTMLRGFRGSVAVAVLDASRNKLWVSKTHTYGVDGTLLGTHDRTENWVDSVPAQLLPQVRYYAIIQKWNPNSAFDDINHWLQGMKTITDVLGPIIKTVATSIKS